MDTGHGRGGRRGWSMLWPPRTVRPGPMTQVEEIVEPGKTWLGEPLDPEKQRAQMREDAQRLLDSYEPPGAAKD
jgi:hypothetical protein